MTFDCPQSDAALWDSMERGPRIFAFRQGMPSVLSNLAKTLTLFEPCLTQAVPDIVAEANLDFLRDNVGIVMGKRPEGAPEVMPLDKTLIRSGDTIDIMRLDGLDPMIAWAMGAATGHTAIALWKDQEV